MNGDFRGGIGYNAGNHHVDDSKVMRFAQLQQNHRQDRLQDFNHVDNHMLFIRNEDVADAVRMLDSIRNSENNASLRNQRPAIRRGRQESGTRVKEEVKGLMSLFSGLAAIDWDARHQFGALPDSLASLS